MFEFLYLAAAGQAAETLEYTWRPDPVALASARSKFVADYTSIEDADFEKFSWEKHLSITTALLVRATAAYSIVQYIGPVCREKMGESGVENSQAFNSNLVRQHTNEIVAFAFGVAIASFEMSLLYRSLGYYSANIELLSTVSIPQLRTFVMAIVEDRKTNFTKGQGMRRDFRMNLTVIRMLLRKHYDNSQPLPPEDLDSYA